MSAPLTVKHEDMVIADLKQDSAYRKATLLGAIEELLIGERYVACASLRRLIAATVGFRGMAEITGIHEKSLLRMLGPKGNPTTDNLLAIIRALAEREKVTFAIKEAKTRKAA
jgi:DNA-binding phage protein